MAIDPFGLSPEAAIQFFRAKGYALSFDYRDVWKEQHARAFTVAKATQLDILADIRQAVDDSIANGTTLATFRKQLKPTLQSKGWWGEKEVPELDANGKPTGETKLVQLGSARRLGTIYETNLRTAQAAGRWDRFQQTKATRPYARYVALLDGRERAEHQAWHGTVLPIDSSWWNTHAPPNGWGCRCKMQQLSQRDLDRYGYQVSEHAPPVEMVAWHNERTGLTQMVPKGIDPGFNYNPGKQPRAFQPLDSSMPLQPIRDFGSYDRPSFRQIVARGEFPPAAPLWNANDHGTVSRLWSSLFGSSIDDSAEVRDPLGMQSTFSGAALAQIIAKAGLDAASFVPRAKQTIEAPTEVWMQPHRLDDGTVKMRLFYVGSPASDGKTASVVVVTRTDSGHAVWSSVPADRIDAKREGYLLYPRPSK